MSLKNKIKKKVSLGNGNNTLEKREVGNKKSWILINGAKEVLKNEIGLTNLWFKDNAWAMRQQDIAIDMVEEESPNFWLKVLTWCLNHPTDSFARRIRNLRPLIKYMSYYLDDERWKKRKGDNKVVDSRMRMRKGKQYLKDKLKNKY